MGPPFGRSWIQRLLILVSAFLAVGGLLAATSVAYGAYRVGRVPTEALGDVLEGPSDGGPGAGTGGDEGEDVPGAPFNVLLVGDSSRDFVRNDEDRASFGTDDGRGSDSIVLVRIDPRSGTAATLPFPRDLWVELADGSGAQRINKAYENGGARLLIRTIRERFHVPVHHYVQVDFQGFRALVDAVGGVELFVEAPVRDFNRQTGRNDSGLDIPEAGCVQVDGAAALAYVRSRHFERFVDGRWVPDGRNDFGRSERQQHFLRQLLAQATSEGLLSPRRVLDLLEVADRSVTFSDDLDAESIVDLARDVRLLTPDAFTDYALPVADLTTPAGALVLEVRDEEAEPVLDVFRGVVPPASAPTTTGGTAPVAAPPVADVTTTTVAPPALC